MVAAGDLRAHVAQLPARHAFETVDELRQADLRGVRDEQVNVVVFARALDKLGLEVAAHLGENDCEVADRQRGEHVPAEFCDEDQVRM